MDTCTVHISFLHLQTPNDPMALFPHLMVFVALSLVSKAHPLRYKSKLIFMLRTAMHHLLSIQ